MTTEQSLSNQSSPPAEIAKAIVAVMKATRTIEMTGFNKHQSYKYASIEDVLKAVQPAMADAGLALIMSTGHWTSDEAKNFVVEYTATLVHETGEVWKDCARWLGVARAMDDKWANKCHTAAEKTFLVSLFHIPRGIEDDADAHDGMADVKSSPPRRAPTKAAKAPPPPQKAPDGKPDPLAAWWAKGNYAIPRTDRDGVIQDPVTWARRIERYLEAAPNMEAVKAFWQTNKADITALENDDSSLFQSLISTRNAMLDKYEPMKESA